MCGRFAVQLSKDELALAFEADLPDLEPDDLPCDYPRLNIAPSQSILAIGRSAGKPHPRFAMLRWGLIPHFTKDPKAVPSPFNIRSETAASKPMFRQAFERRRCLIPATGFYEWKHEGRVKRPFLIQMKDRRPFSFAGLYEIWRGEAGTVVSCAILTTEANEAVREVHDRMPVIIEPKDRALWCDPDMRDTAELQRLLRPCAAERIELYPAAPGATLPLDSAAGERT